ncbi:mitochondrial cytochrome C oxidase assembly protein Mss51 [Schizosaccharomyces osmophilus]|uniref:Mitochondrial cytochrome C oxidase assembly protein Mss51 n=1 Tax=Schizosaccharomyces osmophilus TaxID=2545709 RepID=A0AAF0AZ89_9SCHI|nr:mitochondrial cytochrome C oxidase assembly protein Mss51 [Schizosaccharomyces osmophilus]WBW75018.1 mitochondrial cytochrome C oxidase assembly protein Mss51 [Schizosaccharomyces osmophilus]
MFQKLLKNIGITNLIRKKATEPELFFPLSKSPVKALRSRAEHIQRVYKCPISGKQVSFDCPESGFPSHCSKAHWEQDETHQALIPKLRQINEDFHDLARPNSFPQLANLPGLAEKDVAIALWSWDSYFYTRGFPSIGNERTSRHLTSLLTYPMTIGGILHKNSPYNLKNGLTPQGLQALAVQRYMLNRPTSAQSTDPRPTRIFILGSRFESALPPALWLQGINFLFPGRLFQLHFVGPELVKPTKMSNLPSPLSLHFHQDYYHNLHKTGTFEPFDPYYDTFFLPMPDFANPEFYSSWVPTLHDLISTKCAVWVTSPSTAQTKRDTSILQDVLKDSFETLLSPQQNIFASRAWTVNDDNLHNVFHVNDEIYGFRSLHHNVQNV